MLGIVADRVEGADRPIDEVLDEAVLEDFREPPRSVARDDRLELVGVVEDRAVLPTQAASMPSSSCGLSAAVRRIAADAAAMGTAVLMASQLGHDRVRHPLVVRVESARNAQQHVTDGRRCVLAVCEPGGRPFDRGRGPDALGDRGATEKVLPKKRCERLSELLLALDNDRGMGDRESQWVTEQRRDREPVGEHAPTIDASSPART